MFKKVISLSDFQNQIKNNEACLFYFSHDACNVCVALKPKISELITTNFPEIKMFYIDTKKYPEISAQNHIFTNPVILIYFQGKEFYRKARNLSIHELKKSIDKPYRLLAIGN